MNQSPGVRALIALAAGSLVWNALFQILFFTGGAVIIELLVITAVAALFAVVVFRALPKTVCGASRAVIQAE